MFKSHIIATLLGCNAVALTANAQPQFFEVNPKGTWRNDLCDRGSCGRPFNTSPTIIDLAGLGVAACDVLHLSTVGSYYESCDNFCCASAFAGLFSSSTTLLPSICDDGHRVPGAIAAQGPQWDSAFCCGCGCCDCAADIPEDFLIGGELDIVVPAGALYLFIAPPDRYVRDNVAAPGPFGVSVSITLRRCAADVNQDCVVNSQDLFDFLTCFFTPQCPEGDFTRDGVVNSQDFFDFLAAFFSGC